MHAGLGVKSVTKSHADFSVSNPPHVGLALENFQSCRNRKSGSRLKSSTNIVNIELVSVPD